MRSIKEANIHPKIKYVKYIKPIGITAHSRLGCKDDASSHRHSFMFISLNLSFYIIFSKIPIKTSVKYLATQISFLPSSFTFHFYLIHQFPSFSVFPFFYQINHNYHITSSQSLFSESNDINKRPTSP